ncbi:MAG TPA: protein kinase, partial [Ktedonobacteraceae bacterium]|nr:protein kinase [Ktedonobacteraceae bacterium]
LLPMTPLSSNQLAAFLERFRRETDAAASLEHPNIMPVHEYGERDGLAYLVMPYISGGTLRDELEREGPLPLDKVINYLDQIAAALDFAHERGVIHRDIKPANILMTPEGRLLLTDFGLVKIVAEGQVPQTRLTGAGAPVGTPDYMAPEQVIGEEVDARADLYSLGVILYQLVTGTTPFQGETPMQIAAQHLQLPPPSPQMLRPELPYTAEQVILKALAKRPSDRYALAQDMAQAFRQALIGTGQLFGTNTGRTPAMSSSSTSGLPKGLLDPPPGQTASFPRVGNGGGLLSRTGMMPSVTSSSIPVANVDPSRAGGGLLSRTGKFPLVGTGATGMLPVTTTPTGSFSTFSAKQSAVMPPDMDQQPFPTKNTTGSLAFPGQQPTGMTSTVKLTGPVKVVKVPVAGQPGQFVTGILPAAPQMPEPPTEEKKKGNAWTKIVTLILVLLIIAGAVGTFLFVRGHSNTANTMQQSGTTTMMGTPNATATVQAQATANAQANIILSDPLDKNIHNWLTTPPDVFAFKDGAYHITDRGDNGRATVLVTNSLPGDLGYQVTMQEVNGNDNSINNSYGMIFRFNQDNKNGKSVTSFYSFEIVNTKGGEYQFWKYDDGQGGNTSPWTKLWTQAFGNEFHQGHGQQAVNTIKVSMKGNTFSFTINGKQLGKTVQDGALTKGTVGMIVNLNGTEVAFKDLLLTRN